MSSEYPAYCPICGDDGDHTTPSRLSSGPSVFQCFLKLFGAKWRGKSFSFCEACRSQLTLISGLQRDLQELQKRLEDQERELRNKLEGSEAKFEKRRLYVRDERYLKLRKQILRDNVLIPSSLSDEREESSPQPLQENHIKVEVEDPSNEDSDSPVFEADEQTHSDPTEGTIHEDPETSPAPTRRQRSSNQKRRKFCGNLDSASEDNDSDDEFLPDEEDEQDFGVRKKGKSDAKERLTVDKKVIHIHKCRLHLVSGDNYKCSKCDAILPNQRTILRSHVVKNHTLIHSCSQCNFTFDCKSALKRHNDLVHNKLPKIECPICARPFTRADNFKSHSWTHYSEQEKAEAVARGEKAPYSHNKSERFQCDQCSRVFYKSKALERHLKERHSNGEKQLCPLCGASVVDVKRHTMISHTAPENRRFECSMCSKRFVLNNHLQVHRKKAHSTDKPFKCEVCGKDFKFVTNLKEHQLQHSNVKPFECYVCKMAFSRKQVMKRHVASVHEGKKRSDNKKCKKQ